MRYHVAAFVLAIAASAVAVDAQTIDLAEPLLCPPVEGTGVGPDEERSWNSCEKWAWSCIRQGLEANFYAKRCVEQRSEEARGLRRKHRYAPFFEPERFRDANGIGSRFLYTILTSQRYASEIHPAGIRLVGAYFERLVNLENVTTDKNLVFDQSIFRAGVRLTNFKSEKNLSLDGSNVRGRILMLRANIAGTVFMEEGVYDGVDAADARIGASIDAPNSIFNSPFRLDRVRVDGKVSFIRSRLTELTAWDTTIGSKLELRYAHVRGRIDLTGSRIEGDLRMQRTQFGRALAQDAPHHCDWDLRDNDRFFLNPELAVLKAQPDVYRAIVREAVTTRPIDGQAEYPCLKLRDSRTGVLGTPSATHHEVLLRDMKIGGALCLIDITGEIEAATSDHKGLRRNVSIIALDGTEARSTIIRWRESPSMTLWQAVHFKTKNLFIDLSSQPRRHFLDNLEIGNISFIRPGSVEVGEQNEESRAYLCDVRPGPGARFASDDAKTHLKIIEFFTSEANLARSPQPFGEVVARLNDSNSSSLTLKMALSEYKLGKVCRTSQYFKSLPDPSAYPPGTLPGDPEFMAALSPEGSRIGGAINEVQRIVLDAACNCGLAAYKYSVAYGHQPHNIVLLMAVFVLGFRLLLLLDTPGAKVGGHGTRRQLGILYSIDMFTPFVKLNPRHSELRPARRSLRGYLIFHRVVGLVLTTLLVIGIYAARF